MRKLLSIVLTLVMIVSILPLNIMTVSASTFAGGDGTAENPYQVANAEQLNAVRNNLSAHYIQIQDIDLSQYDNWTPIGTGHGRITSTPHLTKPYKYENSPFWGSYNGNNKTIRNLTINTTEYDSVGLFGKSEGTISNVILENVSIVAKRNESAYPEEFDYSSFNVGAIAGYSTNVVNSKTTGKIEVYGSRSTLVGGITGIGGTVDSCENSVAIYVKSDSELCVGGIVGHTETIDSSIQKCINDGNIEAIAGGSVFCGGISGEYGAIKYCINKANVKGDASGGGNSSFAGASNVGGIVGATSSNVTSYCVNLGNVYSYSDIEYTNQRISYAGGIAGFCGYYGSGKIDNCYNMAEYIFAESQEINFNQNRIISGYSGRIAGNLIKDNTSNCFSTNNTLVNNSVPTKQITSNDINGETKSESYIQKEISKIIGKLNVIILECDKTVNVGNALIIRATHYDENGNISTDSIEWSNNNSSVLHLSNSGTTATVKGIFGGKATVTATHIPTGATASIEITVNDYTVELEEEYSEFLDEEKETTYNYKVKNGNSVALASETEVVLEIVNKDGTEIARIKNYNDYSGTFEIEGLAIGECELVAKINGVEMDRAPINILGNIADTINNETVLRAKVLLNNNRYKYYRDNDSIHHVHIDGIGLGTSVFYQNAGNSLNLLFESITEGKSTNDINASQAYKVVLLKLLYGGNKLDEYMDYANKIDTYFLKYGSMIENQTPILGVNNVKGLKTQFSNLLKGSTIDLGILDSVLVVGKSMRECISEMERIYMLASCSDSQVKALKLIAANTSDKNLKQACNELATEIIIATDTKLIQAAGTGFVAGWNTLVEETACSVVQGALNFIPGVTVWNISLDATKLGLNSLFKIDDSAEDLINLSALHSIENSLYNAMLNAEKKFSSNMTADNALNFMATADFYKEILLYGNDIIRNMVVHNAEAKVNLNATKLVLKSLFDSEKDLVDTVNNYFEKEGITHQLECIDQLKTRLENADFYSTDGVDIAAYIREVKSTTPSEWAKPEIKKAIGYGFLPDYIQNNYQNNITRAEFCTILTWMIKKRLEKVLNS